jgi:drug/metabolite transporter (DMT)-like permease
VSLAVLLALCAGSFWAVNIVAVRWGLDRTGASSMAGATVGIGLAAALVLVAAAVGGGESPSSGDLWRFALVGAIAPGSSQGLFLASIRTIGPSRSSVLVGTAPMLAVLLAIVLLGEQLDGWILVGTALTIVGGALISWERGVGFLQFGAVLALMTAFTFGLRDVVARDVTTGTELGTLWSAAIVLSSATVVLMLISLVTERGSMVASWRRAMPEFVLSGVMIALALPTLLAALSRGRVGVVAPISNAMQNLAVVAISGIVFGARERTPRVIAALALVALGGTLVSTR